MSLRHKLFDRWRAKIIASVVVALLAIALWQSPISRGLTYFSYDLPFALKKNPAPDDVLVVFMDEESRARLNQPVQGPWDRASHVLLLNKLFAYHAKAVAFDILFDEPWQDTNVDEQFATAIKAHSNVVLAASCQYSGGHGQPVVARFTRAAEPLGSAALWGVAEWPLDTDGTVRKQRYDPQYPSLAWQTAALCEKLPPRPVLRSWINYYGQPNTIPHVSYSQVLDPDGISPTLVSNRIVFVGASPIITYQGSSSDEFATPYTRWTGWKTSGVEIQATACLNLMRHEWMSQLPFSLEAMLLVLTAFVATFGLPLFRPGIAAALGVCCAILVAIIAVFVALQQHWWFSWAVISFVEIPAATGWTVLSPLGRRTAPNLESVEEDNGLPRVPDHELIREFGHGSYGQVWLARNALGNYRAVKLVFRNNFDDDKPFEREFRGIEAFEPISRSHEGFIHILQVGRREQAGYFYCVMEVADDQNSGQTIQPQNYVPRTLANDLSRRGRIPCEECAEWGMLMCGALQRLHEAGLLHRDIKPSNIIFVGGTPKLADIGLVAEASSAMTFVGTEGFIPPEGPGTPQSDIYSLGKVLYEIAMGRDRCSFPELPTLLAEDPERERLMSLNEIILKACRSNPARRYSSAEKMQTDLKRLLNRIRSAKKSAS